MKKNKRRIYKENYLNRKTIHDKKRRRRNKINLKRILWKYIGRERRCRTEPSKNIKMEDWYKHFTNQLNSTKDKTKLQLQEKLQTEWIEEITLEELQQT